MLITTATATSTAPPSAFFARWADTTTWPEWNTDTEWVRLDGPFTQGATGTLKPKGGPKVRFVVSVLDESTFVDDSTLLGARLRFAHRIASTPAGTVVDVSVTLDGPLARVWKLVLGGGIAASAQADLDRLVVVAEQVTA